MKVKTYRVSWVLVLMTAVAVLLSACGGSAPSAATTEPATKPAATGSASPGAATTAPAAPVNVDNSETSIGVMVQEGSDAYPIEILMITYDGQQPALNEYNGKNPEIEIINNQIKAGPLAMYNKMDADGDWEEIEIRSYPFVDEGFVQIVTTCMVFPSTNPEEDTHLWSYNFDKTSNEWIMVDDMLDDYDITRDEVEELVRAFYVPEADDAEVYNVEITGFLINRVPAKPKTHFLIEVSVETQSDPYKDFLQFTPDVGTMYGDEEYEIIVLDPYMLFDPDVVDMLPMDPPLAYEQQWYSYGQDYDPDDEGYDFGGYYLTMDVSGFDEIFPGELYSYDDLLVVELESYLATTNEMYNEDTILDRITFLEDWEITRVITVTLSEPHSAWLTYPAWMIVYEIGSNEDTRHCVDIYFQTDTGEYRAHTEVPVDYELDYHDLVGERLSTLSLTYSE